MPNALKFIGLDTRYPTADNRQLRRIHLDGAASPLAAQVAVDTLSKVLPHYSNTHSYVHQSAKISTQALAWAHRSVLDFVGADPQQYTAFFTGAGTTAGINRIARGLRSARPEKRIVLVSAMEHHANDLPHRDSSVQVIYLPLCGDGNELGAVDLARYQALCEEHNEHINYVAVSSVSNVTGISNPITEMARIAHHYSIPIVVDAAQSVAHRVTNLTQSQADFLVFSGHKVYSPMSPGVVVGKRALLQAMDGQDLGGGSVTSVSYFDYQLHPNYPNREQSGTPNIVGAIVLAAVLKSLREIGLAELENKESHLMQELIAGLSHIHGLTVYGDPSLPRTGAVAFNIQGIDHGLLAAILNDYFAIAVRNECFCAHPYVSSLIKEELWELDLSDVAESDQEAFINRKRGMVRVSLSAYNTATDVENLLSALATIVANIEHYASHYKAHDDGSYTHTSYALDWTSQLAL